MKEFLQKRWHDWKRVAKFMGDMIGRVFLTLFYFTLFMPFGLGMRIWGDHLGMRPRSNQKWLDRETKDLTLKDTRRLY